MVSLSGSVFSETLQEITNTKLEELSKRRSDFETTRSEVLAKLQNESQPIQRLHILNQGVRTCYGLRLGGVTKPASSELEIELKNLDNFLIQAKCDPSLSAKITRAWEESLLRHLDMQSLKYQYASLYAQLVTEWLSTEKSTGGDEVDVATSEGFEDVADSLKRDFRSEWESSVFEPAPVDEERLREYLGRLFSIEDEEISSSPKALKTLRESVAIFEHNMASPNQFDTTTLQWVIDGLLTSDLLPDEKREVLKDFKKDDIILSEIVDVLNMRISSFTSWSWGPHVPLEQRRKISGVYDIFMVEDLLQAIFLQYIGVKWSVFLKGAFKGFQQTSGAWKSCSKPIPRVDVMRRAYYLGPENRRRWVQDLRATVYRKYYFVAGLLDHHSQRSETVDGEAQAEYQTHVAPMSAPAPAFGMPAGSSHAGQFRQAVTASSHAGLFGKQNSVLYNEQFVGDANINDYHIDDDEDGSDTKQPMQSHQRLLRLLSTEIAINTKLYGEITAFHSVFEDWNTLLPHQTILTVLSFLGVSKTWLAFFKKFLGAPLKFLEDDPSVATRNRRRGTPTSHVLSDVFRESILFCLDFAVNKSTDGALLFRMHDDFWFWSRDHSVAVTAWKSVTEFAGVTGTRINNLKSGTVRIPTDTSAVVEIDKSLPRGDIRWGLLSLSAKSGKFEIDQTLVDKYIVDLRKQLGDKRGSIISFIQAWNTYVATFFQTNFGKPANCFGLDHVAQILATHERIQREVFSASSSLTSGSSGATDIVQYLQGLIRERFGISDIPDAYFFFPMELGGLDLKSPFISTLQVHNTVLRNPAGALDKFLEAERDAYDALKAKFEKGGHLARSTKQNWDADLRIDPDTFMSFDEYARYREDIGYAFSGNLLDVYLDLTKVPREEDTLTPSAALMNGIRALASRNAKKGIHADWSGMEPYWKWIAQLYGPEVIDRFGGLSIVEPGLLPTGMVSIFREKRVKWQG
ncbi:hypothetical protein GGS23DRAFT_556882 [Durotheca rogersii]|uniref:uncharacterized protein n=1 Tax=Durotheca rogersii TaxID=419775 RepID=UPI00221F6EDF|nr:uncharacterized protein GGS23DRAFT_556882 [Durotheca rogersii]KAI5866388.1 hypothetical protein GGS23DRAFT_556882 [Durotheca rogersii]